MVRTMGATSQEDVRESECRRQRACWRWRAGDARSAQRKEPAAPDPLAFAPLLMLGLPWTMAGRLMSKGSVGIGVVLVSPAVLINGAILIAATRRLSRTSRLNTSRD